MLKHAQAKRNQSIIRCQFRPINESDVYTLSRVRDLLDYRVEHQLVRGEERLCFLLNEGLETTLVDAKLVVGRETSRSNIESVVVTLKTRMTKR